MGHPYFLASAAGMVEVTSKFSSWWKTPVLHQFYICFTYEKNSQLDIFHSYFSARQRIKANMYYIVIVYLQFKEQIKDTLTTFWME